METFADKVSLEVIKTALSMTILVFTWLLGQKILIFWDRKKKQKEVDSDLANEFQALYAEFKTITRLWKIQRRFMNADLPDLKEKQWQLLCRATNAEGKVEAILMKLSMERELENKDCETLGYFRQAYQQLRESIRESKHFENSFNAPSYKLFHQLSSEVSVLIAFRKNHRQIDLAAAERSLKNIMNIRSKDWERKIKEYEENAETRDDLA